MDEFEKKDKGVSIIFNKNFYMIEAIKESLSSFKDVCKGKVLINKDYFSVVLEPYDKKTTSFLKGEFGNYVLGLMKNKVLV